MSTGSAPSSGGKGLGQDVELNIASIVDCFTVLITYLLAAASFLSVGALDVTVAGTDNTISPQDAAQVTEVVPTDLLVMELTNDHHIHFKSYGSESGSVVIPSHEGVYDYAAAGKFVQSYKAKHPTLQNVVLSAQNDVAYGDVVQATDATKKTLPVVFASGDSV